MNRYILKREQRDNLILTLTLQINSKKFLASDSPLKIMKNAFYFILKAHFALKFLSSLFGHEEKRVD